MYVEVAMKTKTGTQKELLEELDDTPKDFIYDFWDDGQLFILDRVARPCWCCGALRLRQSFVTHDGGIPGKVYQYIRTPCLDTPVTDPCLFSKYGAGEDDCHFKDAMDAACNSSGKGKSVKDAVIEYFKKAIEKIEGQ